MKNTIVHNSLRNIQQRVQILPEFHPNTGQVQSSFWTAVICNQNPLLFVTELCLFENLFPSDSQLHPDATAHSAQKAIQT